MTEKVFAAPTECALWDQPELVAGSTADVFELLEVYVDEPHHLRYLLECRECGQRYFFEFYEWIDWVGGNDPQYSTYIPVGSAAEIEALRKATPMALLECYPRIQKDFPEEAGNPTVHWVTSS